MRLISPPYSSPWKPAFLRIRGQKKALLVLLLSALSSLIIPFDAIATAQPITNLPRFYWPCPPGPVPVVRPFQPPPQPWNSGHRGVDLDCGVGTTIKAAQAGTVYFVGTIAGVTSVSVAHPGGIRSTYQPLEPTVQVGQTVQVGTPLGTLLPGHPGNTLHFGAKINDRLYLNPLFLLYGPIRLYLEP